MITLRYFRVVKCRSGKRDRRMAVRFTEGEFARIEAKAKAEGWVTAVWIGIAALAMADPEAAAGHASREELDGLVAATEQVRRAGYSLNQAVMTMHSLRQVRPAVEHIAIRVWQRVEALDDAVIAVAGPRSARTISWCFLLIDTIFTEPSVSTSTSFVFSPSAQMVSPALNTLTWPSACRAARSTSPARRHRSAEAPACCALRRVRDLGDSGTMVSDSGAFDELSRIDAGRRQFLDGTIGVMGAGLLLGRDGTALFTIHLATPVPPPLSAVLDRVEAGEIIAVRGHLRWAVWDDPEVPLARLTMILTAPVSVHAAMVIDCRSCSPFLWAAARGGQLAVSSGDTDDLARCLVLPVPWSSALSGVIRARGWPSNSSAL